jgi:hypothetical protein
MSTRGLIFIASLLGLPFVTNHSDAQIPAQRPMPPSPAWRFEHRVLHDYRVDPDAMNGECAIVDINKNQWQEHILAETGSHNARVGDINGDGLPDIIGSNWNSRLKDYPLKAEVWINRIGRAPASD